MKFIFISMTTLETIERIIHDNEKLSTVEHGYILDRIERLEKKFDEKIVVLDKNAYEFQAWKNYIIGIIAVISIAVSITSQYLFT